MDVAYRRPNAGNLAETHWKRESGTQDDAIENDVEHVEKLARQHRFEVSTAILGPRGVQLCAVSSARAQLSATPVKLGVVETFKRSFLQLSLACSSVPRDRYVGGA